MASTIIRKLSQCCCGSLFVFSLFCLSPPLFSFTCCFSVAASQFRVCILRRLHLKANYVTTPRSRQMQPSFTSFWRTQCYDPSWPHISQDSLRAEKEERKERKRRHRLAQIVPFAGLGGRNRDVRGKHLVTQPGNAPKARPSHLSTANAINKVSSKDSPLKTEKAGSFEGCRP